MKRDDELSGDSSGNGISARWLDGLLQFTVARTAVQIEGSPPGL